MGLGFLNWRAVQKMKERGDQAKESWQVVRCVPNLLFLLQPKENIFLVSQRQFTFANESQALFLLRRFEKDAKKLF